MRRPSLTLLLAALVASVVVVEHVLDRPPTPRPESAPATEFSELRARPLLYDLTRVRHAVETPELDSAIEMVAARVRAIPGVEVEMQDAEGVVDAHGGATFYATRNIVARLRGSSDEAVLISAHTDSAVDGPGAGDDGVAVAATVEALRALAAGPKLPRSIVVNLNGAEEAGLLGATGFLQHHWLKDVRAFVNLDAAGTSGRAALFRVTPGSAWLVDAYAKGAPHPFGTVFGQDLFRAGLVPSDTDFHVYNDEKMQGVDIALFEDGYAYHTPLDTYDRVEPGTLQHMGDDLLGLTRELASMEPVAATKGWPVFYDLLGLHLFHMSNGTARLAGWLVVLLVIGVVLVRGRGQLGTIIRAAGWTWLSLLAGLALPLLVATLVGPVLHRALGWFSVPALACIAYAPLALAGSLLVGARREQSPLGSLLGATLVLALAVAFDVGSAYIIAWWCLATALALLAPRLTLLPIALWAVPVCFTISCVAALVRLSVPLQGRTGFGQLSELAVAASIALPIAVSLAPITALLPSRRTAGLAMAAVGAVGVVLCVVHQPYTAKRPARVLFEHRVQDGKGLVLEHDGQHVLPAGAPYDSHTLPPPVVTVTRGESKNGLRSFEISLAGSHVVRLEIPPGSLKGWSIPLPIPEPYKGRPIRVSVLGGLRAGRVVKLRVDVPDGSKTVLTATSISLERTPALAAIKLPENVTPSYMTTTAISVPLEP